MDKVTFKKTQSYDLETVKASVDAIMKHHGVDKGITCDSKILLKPNMLAKNAPEKAITTHPSVVAATIEALISYGAKNENITIADSSGGPGSQSVLQSNYETCGFAKVARDYNVNLYTNIVVVKVKSAGKTVREFEVMEPAAKSDVIINLAKLKTHVMTGMTGATKNLFGTIPGLKKAEFHMRFEDKADFGNMIVDLAQTIKPTFTIVDAVVGLEGDGPASGNPRQMGFLMGSESTYNIDLAICCIMGIDPLKTPITAAFLERGLANWPLEENCIDGDTNFCETIPDFQLPSSYSLSFEEYVPKIFRKIIRPLERVMAPKPSVIKSKCIGCKRCQDICPKGAITVENKKAQIDLSKCIKCFCCHEMCPIKAIKVKRFKLFRI